MLNNSFFPEEWKKSKITPTPKKGNESSNPADFRLIIISNMLQICDEKNIILEAQFGFKHKHSTIHAINKLTSDVCWALNNKQYVGACLIDLEKAFDTFWIEGLIYKLMKLKFPKHLIKMIREIITGKCFVITDGNISIDKVFPVLNGLHQEAVLSLILFNILTNY